MKPLRAATGILVVLLALLALLAVLTVERSMALEPVKSMPDRPAHLLIFIVMSLQELRFGVLWLML